MSALVAGLHGTRAKGLAWFGVFAIATLAAGIHPACADEATVVPVSKTVLDLQDYKRTTSLAIGGKEDPAATAALVEINPYANAWYLVTVSRGQPAHVDSYHLENPLPHQQRISRLNASGIELSTKTQAVACSLWSGTPSALERARQSGLPYAPLCDGHLYLRNRVTGGRTLIEGVTGFLRDNIYGGDKIVNFVRKELFQDRYIEAGAAGSGAAAEDKAPPGAPPAAQLDAQDANRAIETVHLGLDLGERGPLLLGHWYPVAGAPGIYVSAIKAAAIDPALMKRDQPKVSDLDAVESEAVNYLVAFDLSQFEMGYAVGTVHPRVSWSERALDSQRKPGWPGPDGIGDISPLVGNGMLDPASIPRVAGTFVGGFKREHGAFHYGTLSQVNAGSHYGFIEQSAVLSRLQPGIATIYVLDDGSIGMKTWTAADNALLPRILHARQNGVPLIEYDAAKNSSTPGALVSNWGLGNWSGSADEKLRAVRAGICLRETPTQRFLIYGYFSSATPSAMVRVFQSYGCRYAMHLDMNALEHTYMALYTRSDGQMLVQHLIQGMEVVDKSAGDRPAPRFIGFPDNRDFFYVLRKAPAP